MLKNSSHRLLMSIVPYESRTPLAWAGSALLTTTTHPSDINNMTDETSGVSWTPYEIWQVAILSILFSVIIIGTLVGNGLVCIAVAMVKKLRSPTNLLIVSLAVADMLVALLVMPFAAMLEIRGGWELGQAFCKTWTSMDVMLCTASILNLCMISVDRYLVITRPFEYAMKRTPKRMALMIFGVWSFSALISIPPLFGFESDPQPGQCVVTQSIGYQFYATIGAFYLPLSVMIFIYYRIYMVSSRLAATEARSMPNMGHEITALNSTSPEHNHNCPNGSVGKRDSRCGILPMKKRRFPKLDLFKKSHLNKISSSKDRKATKTLGIIMGAFTACWLPFFILALIRPFASDSIPQWLYSIFLWLGYCNSLLNPIIYARFNRDFRTPFKEILCCRCHDINYRLRSESYMETYGAVPRGSRCSTTLKDAIRLPTDTVVRYNSDGQTIVKPFGNGHTPTNAVGDKSTMEAKL